METLEKTDENRIESEYQEVPGGPFKEGNPGGGRPKDTPELKLAKKAAKQIIAEYKEALAEALPLIQPVLIKKALEGDIPALKELHDRAMGKAPQQLLGDKENPLLAIIFDSALNKDAININTESGSK